jgi:hypothetical protein
VDVSAPADPISAAGQGLRRYHLAVDRLDVASIERDAVKAAPPVAPAAVAPAGSSGVAAGGSSAGGVAAFQALCVMLLFAIGAGVLGHRVSPTGSALRGITLRLSLERPG